MSDCITDSGVQSLGDAIKQAYLDRLIDGMEYPCNTGANRGVDPYTDEDRIERIERIARLPAWTNETLVSLSTDAINADDPLPYLKDVLADPARTEADREDASLLLRIPTAEEMSIEAKCNECLYGAGFVTGPESYTDSGDMLCPNCGGTVPRPDRFKSQLKAQ